MDCLIFAYTYWDTSMYSSTTLKFCTNVTATLPTGFVSDFNITFLEDYKESELWTPSPRGDTRIYESLRNLSIAEWGTAFDNWWLLQGNIKGFFRAVSINHPRSVHFWTPAEWILRSAQNHTHQMEIDMQLTYFNGTVYKRIVQPFLLTIKPDDNNNFETADSVDEGAYSGLYLGGYDSDDYYKIYVPQGHVIDIHAEITSHPIANFCLYLHNPERELKASTLNWNYSQTVTYVADSAGEWFIHTRNHAGHGVYTLTITVYPP
jgi:hypothetical protein